MTGGSARNRIPVVISGPGKSAVGKYQNPARRHFKRQRAGLCLGRGFERWRRTDVRDDDRSRAFEPGIARGSCGGHDLEVAAAISKNRCKRRRRAGADAVEARQHAIAETHEAQETQGFPDSGADFFRRFAAARVEALAKRQKVQDKVGQNAGASADVAAIIENLALQFFDKRILRFFQLPVMSGDCEIGENERDETGDARNAVGRVAPCRLQRDDLLADALHDRRVRSRIEIFEQHVRLGDP